MSLWLQPEAYGTRLFRRVAALDDDVLDNAAAVAAEAGGFLILGRLEAGDALLQGRETRSRRSDGSLAGLP